LLERVSGTKDEKQPVLMGDVPEFSSLSAVPRSLTSATRADFGAEVRVVLEIGLLDDKTA
jgi:hypothetical protein